MSTVTQNLGLIKDDENDFYDVNRVNDNLDKIDQFAEDNAETTIAIMNGISTNTEAIATNAATIGTKVNQSDLDSINTTVAAKANKADLDGLAGTNRTTETVKGNADAIADNTRQITSNLDLINNHTNEINDNSNLISNNISALNNVERSIEDTFTGNSNGTLGLYWSNHNVCDISLNGALAINFHGTVSAGKFQSCLIRIKQGSTAYSVTFGNTIKWDNDEIPDMTEVNKVYTLTFYTIDGGTTFVGQLINTHSA